MATKRTTLRGKRTGERSGRGGEPKPAPFAKNTMSGPSVSGNAKARAKPSDAVPPPVVDAAKEPLAVRKLKATEQLAGAMPHNRHKAAEYQLDSASAPPEGEQVKPTDPLAGASTTTEDAASEKLGDGEPPAGENPTTGPLQRVRVDSGGQALTTNQGVPISDNQNTLKAGVRGPALLEDFVLREKVMHFDHERIPERVVHARGSGAHGYFECYAPLTEYTRAAPFAAAGKRTPAFVRFSTVAGERGSADTVRDARGFAVKFYTEDGNWDLVGNNIPVFFIQDPMKFPDLVHALKPEPHHAMPQASSAHDTFWDFVSLMPESTHMLMWVMSDRAIPRSYRMMQGFGVHTFRLVNEAGESVFCKFHWRPLLGTHSLAWDEAVKIAGADADFHRRDLWEAIEAGAYPEYELGLQIFTEEEAERFTFDVLDSTKIVPEELVPVVGVGKLVLNRNPDNFFAETEQVAFCTTHVVPGIDFSNDPLLQGRNFSYMDTQLLRLGGANFHEIPINAPVAPVHNNQRDGLHRQAIPRGRVAYEPNSLGGGCPFQAGMRGYVSFPQRIEGDKVRGKPEKFADHYTQARLFWASQTSVEKAHIIAAFRFELTRTQTNAVRSRVLAMLANVDGRLAAGVAEGLGIAVPKPLPQVLENPPAPEIERSPALSLAARPGDGSIGTRRVAVLVADGIDEASTLAVYRGLAGAGAVPRFVGVRLGTVGTGAGSTLGVEVTTEAAPNVLFDALVLPDGSAAEALARDGHVLEFVKDQYRHCKPILALGGSSMLLEMAGIRTQLACGGGVDPGVLVAAPDDVDATLDRFMVAIAKHRHFERESDPPRV